LQSGIGEGMDVGTNPRVLERNQLVRLMTLFADVFFVGQWDPELGGRKLEFRLQKGDPIPEGHLRAWRIAREEVLSSVLSYMRAVMENYYAYAGEFVDKDRILHRAVTDVLWQRIELFLKRMRDLPCWIDRNLSTTVFGAKQNREFWSQVFQTGRAPTGVQVLAKPINIMEMIQDAAVPHRS
jgi:hypothetical protein